MHFTLRDWGGGQTQLSAIRQADFGIIFHDVRLPVIWSIFGPFGSTKELGPERVLLVSISW